MLNEQLLSLRVHYIRTLGPCSVRCFRLARLPVVQPDTYCSKTTWERTHQVCGQESRIEFKILSFQISPSSRLLADVHSVIWERRSVQS